MCAKLALCHQDRAQSQDHQDGCQDGRLETPSTFIEAMAAAATPVSIIATDGPAGRFGITISAVVSVSADPPIILACINRRSPAVAAIAANGVFSVNMLAAHQHALADCFAGRPDEGAAFDFNRGDWRDAATGSPILETAVASFDCLLNSGQDAGTHRLITGRVGRAWSSAHRPLVYADRDYQTLQPLRK